MGINNASISILDIVVGCTISSPEEPARMAQWDGLVDIGVGPSKQNQAIRDPAILRIIFYNRI